MDKRTGVIEGYEKWLMALVQADEERFSCLCHILHDMSFIPMLEMDENRCEDGLGLRIEYAEMTSENSMEEDAVIDMLDDALGAGECTMLELMTTLAERLRYEMTDSQYEAGTGKWFMEMLVNVGLNQFDNRTLEDDPRGVSLADVQRRVYAVIFREYDINGEGGLFPLSWSRGDQRKTELLIQLNNYIEDHYDIC